MWEEEPDADVEVVTEKKGHTTRRTETREAKGFARRDRFVSRAKRKLLTPRRVNKELALASGIPLVLKTRNRHSKFSNSWVA